LQAEAAAAAAEKAAARAAELEQMQAAEEEEDEEEEEEEAGVDGVTSDLSGIPPVAETEEEEVSVCQHYRALFTGRQQRDDATADSC